MTSSIDVAGLGRGAMVQAVLGWLDFGRELAVPERLSAGSFRLGCWPRAALIEELLEI